MRDVPEDAVDPRMRTGLFFQLARGRAIAKTNAMKKARALKARIARGQLVYVRDLSREGTVEVMQYRVTLLVQRARECNREHRHWRRRHLEELKESI